MPLCFPVFKRALFLFFQEYERAVLFRLGRVRSGGPVGPGLFFIIPCIDAIVVTDLRTISFDVPPQEILTKDSVTVAVDAVVYYKINNPLAAVCNVTDYSKSTKLLSSTTLRTALGTKNLSEILSDRESIAMDILEQLDSATNPWGIRVGNPSYNPPLRNTLRNIVPGSIAGCRTRYGIEGAMVCPS